LQSIATFGILKNLYKNHPYNHHWLGEVEKIKSIGVGDIKRFYSKFIKPESLSLIYVGPLAEEELKKNLKVLEEWKAGREEVPLISKPETLKKLEVYFIDKPKAAQSFITFSFLAPSPSDPEYPALQIGNHLLSGYFMSRLNMKLREEKGFTYGARSSIVPLKFGGYWTFRVPVDIKFTKDALKEIFNELEGITSKKPVEKEEFEKAKNNLILGLPSRFESPDSLISFIEMISTFDLPLGYLNTFPKKLKEVKLEEVQRVMDKYFKEGKFLVVIVSDKEKVLDTLKEFNFEKIIFCDPFGSPIQN
ncbi:MAG: pitrilysin family protein, partial [Thermoanaerobaculia bacterium]